VDDVRFTFGGDATDASRASERVETKLEQLQRQAIETNAALKAIGAPRTGSIAQLGASADRDRRQVDLLEGSLGKVVGTMTKVNVQFRFFQNLMGLIKWPAMIAAVGFLTQGLSALAAGITAVTGALAPMSNAILALPAGISVLVQSIGTMKLAFNGLDDALKAQKSGLDQVEAAQLKLREAQKNHRETMKEATKGGLEYRQSLAAVREAQNALKDAQDAANPALERFAAFIDQRLEPALGRLRRAASQGLLPGFQRGIASALGNLPGIEQVVGRTAGVLGTGFQGLGSLFGEKGFGRDVSKIGGTNVRVISQLSSAMTSFASALRHVMVAGGPFITWLARGVNDLAQWSDRAAMAGRLSGSIAERLDAAKRALQLAWNVLRPFGAALVNIFKAAAPLGREVLTDLAEAAEKFAAWTESAEGQNRLERYFQEVKPALYEVGRLVRDLTTTFFRLGDDPGFARFVQKIRVDLLPTIERLVRETTANFGPALTDALVAIADLIATLAGSSGPLTLFVTAIGHMARFFTNILEAAPIVRQALFTLVGFATTIAALKFTGVITGLASVLGLMRQVGAASGRGAAVSGFMPTIGAVAGRGTTPLGGPLPVAATRGSVGPTMGMGVAAPAGVPVAPATMPSRFQRFGAPAAGVGGLVAAGTGASLGGIAGGALSGAGLGLALGSVGGPIGMGIGAAVGGIGGGLLAALTGLGQAAPQIDKLSQSLANLGQSFRNAATAANALPAAQEAVRDTGLNVQAANVQVARAERTLSEIRKQFGKRSLEAREAEIALKIARENQTDALKAQKQAQLEAREAVEADRKARTDQAQQMARTADAMRAEIKAIKERKREGRMTAEQIAEFEEKKQADLNGAVDRYQQKMRNIARVMRQEGRPQLAKIAEAADRAAQKLNDIPTDVQIEAEIRFQAKFDTITRVEDTRAQTLSTMSGSGKRDGPGEPTGLWIGDQFNRAIMAGARAYVNKNRQTIMSRLGPSGDIISVGRWLQSRGLLVGEHPAFGGVTPGVHVKNSYHYQGRALDVNFPGGGQAEMNALDAVEPALARTHPTELLWRTRGHYDHLHVAYALGGRALSRRGKTGRDDIPAMLSHGEFVVTPGGEKMLEGMTFPGVLNWLEGNQPPAFQSGGRAEQSGNAAERIRRMLERLMERGEMVRLRLEAMELRQERSGTGTSASELLAQARFIQRRLIPAERDELRGLRRARRQAVQSGNKELARELKRSIFEQQNEILRLQLEAQQRIRQASEETAAAMREFGGGIGFEFGSSLFTDRLLGSMVGA